MSRGSRFYGYSDGLPSYAARLPQPMTVSLRDADGTPLEVMETAHKGFELTQEVLVAACGQMQVHKGSYIVIEREEA